MGGLVFVDYRQELTENIMRVLLVILFLLLPLEVFAGGFRGAHPARSYSNRINVYHYDGSSRTSHRSGPSSSRSISRPPVGGISGPFKNPDPDARKPENLTACIYGINNTLLYERENKVCPYQYTDLNENRVRLRELGWIETRHYKKQEN